MEIQLPDYIKDILNVLNNMGHAAYVVGGCVRDSLLGIEPHDWDICTDATPDQVKTYFPNTIPVGEKYGTIVVNWYSEEKLLDKYVEVTTFRFDSNYSDGRRPDSVTFGTSILDDLARRDFTINAMAYSPLVGLVDPFEGQLDLERKIIRAVGDPQIRIKEDALRILRAIRFACKYKFTLENSTRNVIACCGSSLKNVSNERIHDELIKILEHSINNQKTLNECVTILTYLFEIDDKDISVWICNKWLTELDYNSPYQLKIWSLLTGYKKLYEMEIWLRKYKFTNEDIKMILNFERIKDFFQIGPSPFDLYDKNHLARILLSKFPRTDLEYYFCKDTNVLDLIYNNLKFPTNIYALEVNGYDFCFDYEGKEVGKILNMLLNYVLEKPELNTKEQLLKIVEEKYGKN